MIKAIILGIVQGATEFLPVSSSAHLVFLQDVLGFNWDAKTASAFDVILHLGTLFSILFALRNDIFGLLGLKSFSTFHPEKSEEYDFNHLGSLKKFVAYILITLVPLFIIVLPFKDKIEEMFVNPTLAGFALLLTGMVLFLTRFIKSGEVDLRSSKWYHPLIIGTVQAIAVIPGISRSGSTISTSMFLGWDRKTATKFSFLMSVPAIIGAVILQGKHLIGSGIDLSTMLAGFISSFVVGYICVKAMIAIVSKKGLWYFAPYCLIMGIIIIIFAK